VGGGRRVARRVLQQVRGGGAPRLQLRARGPRPAIELLPAAPASDCGLQVVRRRALQRLCSRGLVCNRAPRRRGGSCRGGARAQLRAQLRRRRRVAERAHLRRARASRHRAGGPAGGGITRGRWPAASACRVGLARVGAASMCLVGLARVGAASAVALRRPEAGDARSALGQLRRRRGRARRPALRLGLGRLGPHRARADRQRGDALEHLELVVGDLERVSVPEHAPEGSRSR